MPLYELDGKGRVQTTTLENLIQPANPARRNLTLKELLKVPSSKGVGAGGGCFWREDPLAKARRELLKEVKQSGQRSNGHAPMKKVESRDTTPPQTLADPASP